MTHHVLETPVTEAQERALKVAERYGDLSFGKRFAEFERARDDRLADSLVGLAR